MTNPELTNKPVRVIGRPEANRERARGSRYRGGRDYLYALGAYRINTGQWIDRDGDVTSFERRFVLLVNVVAPGRAKTPPAPRENLHTRKHFNWTVLKRVRRSRTDILRRTQFQNRLNVTIHRKVETESGDKLIRPIQKYELSA